MRFAAVATILDAASKAFPGLRDIYNNKCTAVYQNDTSKGREGLGLREEKEKQEKERKERKCFRNAFVTDDCLKLSRARGVVVVQACDRLT